MSEPTNHKVRRLFELLSGLPEDQRAAALDRECRGDASLRERVSAMLAAGQEAVPSEVSASRGRDDAATAALPASRVSPTAKESGLPSPHDSLEPGRMLGNRFRIVSLLGKGGMGAVYRADDLELGRPVAIKLVVDRTVGRDSWMTRLRSEVRTAQQVTHPNVCRVHDIAEADGRTFLFMEFVEGDDLSAVLRRLGRPNRAKAVEIARQICHGLAAAHDKGVLHRDLKPANVMIDGRGQVRITDFGLAGFVDELDDAEAIVGTPAYMAPEQLASGTVSVRSDVYSLGLVLYELVTGKHPFMTDDIDALRRAHAEGSVAPPSSVATDVDPALERIVMQCLQRLPHDRPQSVDQVLAALPAGASPRPSKIAELTTALLECADRGALVRRRILWSILALVCVAGSAFVLLGSLGMASRPGVEPSNARVLAALSLLSLVVLVLGLGFGVLAVAQRLGRHRCRRCGYDLRGVLGRCPECGLQRELP